jgi:MFS family permease
LRRASLAYVVVFSAVAAYVPYLTLYYQTQGLALGYIGALHDRYPRSLLLLPMAGCLAAFGAASIHAAGASPLLPLAVIAFAAGMSGTISPMDVRVLEMAGPDRTAYATVRAFGSIGFMLVAPPIGLIAEAHGYWTIFLILVPLAVVGSVLGTTIPGRSSVGRAPGMLQAPGAVLRHRPIALYLGGALVVWTSSRSISSRSERRPSWSAGRGRSGPSRKSPRCSSFPGSSAGSGLAG